MRGARPIPTDGVHLVVDGMEGGVRQPGLVKVQVLHVVLQLGLDHLHVVENAVIGGLGDGHHPRPDRLVLDERVGLDLSDNALAAELLQRNGADDAQVVARGLQEDRYRAAHHDGVQDALVAVAVHQHHVVAGHLGMPDDLVGRGRAVGHKEQVIGIENARRIGLGRCHRARVVQQLPQLVDRVADIGAQHVLAKELVEHLSHRTLQESHTARVPRAVPRVRTIIGVVHQRLEERGRQRVQVIGGLTDDVARHELRRVLEHVDEAVQLLQDLVRDMLRGARLTEQEDRNVGIAAARLADEGPQVLNGHALGPFLVDLLIIDGDDEGRCPCRLISHHRHVVVGEAPHHLGALVLDGLGQCPDAQATGGIGAPVFIDDDDGKTEFHG